MYMKKSVYINICNKFKYEVKLPYLMDEEEQEIVISYETLYEILKREKNREEAQKLPKNFVNEVSDYISKFRLSLNKKKREVNSFEGVELKKDENRLSNLVGLVSDLYQRREKKIISMALTKSRTGAKLADVAYLTDEEKDFYNALVNILDRYRGTLLKKMIASESEVEEAALVSDSEKLDLVDSNKDDVENKPKGGDESEQKSEKKRMVRFLHAVPKFYDKDMNVLGPFEEDDIASLPSSIVDIFLKKERVEVIDRN